MSYTRPDPYVFIFDLIYETFILFDLLYYNVKSMKKYRKERISSLQCIVYVITITNLQIKA